MKAVLELPVFKASTHKKTCSPKIIQSMTESVSGNSEGFSISFHDLKSESRKSAFEF